MSDHVCEHCERHEARARSCMLAYRGSVVCMTMTVDVGTGMIMDTDVGGFVRGGYANYGHHRLSYLAKIGARACTPFSYLANSEPYMHTVVYLAIHG